MMRKVYLFSLSILILKVSLKPQNVFFTEAVHGVLCDLHQVKEVGEGQTW